MKTFTYRTNRFFLVLVLLAASFNLVNAQNLDLDRTLGEENAKMVELQYGIYGNEAMTAYVDKLGQRLVNQLDQALFDYSFHLVPSMEPNAFALPGGHIYVTTGLIPLLETEDELACILGHEIIHSNNRHSIKQIRNSILPRLFEIPGNLLGVINEDLGALFNAPIQTSNALIFASYSRKHETEADKYGVTLAASAGYNPYSMVAILNRMGDAIEKATGYKEEKSYFANHPYTPDRNADIENVAGSLQVKPHKKISDKFLYEFDGIQFGESPSKGVIRENAFLHPDLDFYFEFPKGWDIENQATNVGAYHPDRNAAVFLSLEQEFDSPEKAGKAFVDKLDREHKSKLSGADFMDLEGKRGYLVSFSENTRDGTMYAYVLWVPLNDKIFRLIGITPIEHRAKLESAAASLRGMSNKEKQSITENYQKIVLAQEGETIEALSKRTGNKLDLELTAIINGKTLSSRLSKGEAVKIVSEKKYL